MAAMLATAACSQQPSHPVRAVVVDIRPHVSPKWNTEQLVVEARTEAGAHGTKEVLKTGLTCRVGDTVSGIEQGLTLTLDDRACQHFSTPPLQR